MPQQPAASPLFTSQPESALPEVDVALQRFWDVVRRTAETMLILRQDNAKLSDEVRRLNDVVVELTNQRELASNAVVAPNNHEAERELLDTLAFTSTEFERLRESSLLVSQERDALLAERDGLRAELEEARTLAATQPVDSQPLFETADTHEVLMERIADLERTIARYRSAGLAYVEDPNLDGQMSLFAPAPPQHFENGASMHTAITVRQGLSPDELRAIAARLDSVAERIGGLFGIS